jgi:hypothetical protein
MDISGGLTTAAGLPNSITTYIQHLLKQGPNFAPAEQAFQKGYQHPSLMESPNGSWIDPNQANTVNATNLQGERGNIAQQDIQNKMGLAGDLTQSSSVFANLMNAIPFLNAMNIKGGMQGSIFGTLGF